MQAQLAVRPALESPVQLVLESDPSSEEQTEILTLVPMPRPNERADRVLRALAQNPSLRDLRERISSPESVNGRPRPFWPER
jgi:hypothetical protein